MSENFDKTLILSPSSMGALGQEAPKGLLTCIDDPLPANPADRVIVLEQGPYTLGWDGKQPPPGAVSTERYHVKLFAVGDMWGIEDLGGALRARVNDVPVTGTWLKQGDVVVLGTRKYRFTVEGGSGSPEKTAKAAFERRTPGAVTLNMPGGRADDASHHGETLARHPKVAPPPKAESHPPESAPRPAAKEGRKDLLGTVLIVLGVLILAIILVRVFL